MTGEVPIVPVVIAVVVLVEILCCHIAFVEILQLALRANERRDLDANMFILLLFGLSVDFCWLQKWFLLLITIYGDLARRFYRSLGDHRVV